VASPSKLALVPLNCAGFDVVLGFSVQRGLSGERSYSFPPMMISSNLSGCPEIVVSKVNFEAGWGLITITPSPMASNEASAVETCAVNVK
jgi:hypothetical protein